MAAFGPNPGSPDPAQPMIDWINAAPLAELATELMEAFPNMPRHAEWLDLSELVDWMFRSYPKQTGIIVVARPVQQSVLEAIQVLEHSELAYVRLHAEHGAGRYWCATRLGLATLAEGKDAVRQRIKDRTGL